MLALLLALGAVAQDSDRDAIIAALEANRDALDRCYTLATDDVPWASGHVMLGFEVDAKGNAQEVKLRNECLHHVKAGKCMVERVGQMSFDPPASGKPANVFYAAVFTPYAESPEAIAKVEKAVGKCRAKAGVSGPAHVKVQYELARTFTRPQSLKVLHSTIADVPEACLERAYGKMRFPGDFEGRMAYTFNFVE